jgi:hypothetical protein
MTQWELCVIETSTKEPFDSFEDYVVFHFFTPEDYARRSTGSVLFDVNWETLERREQRALLNAGGWLEVHYQDALCKLLREGWEPLASSVNGQGALVHTLRRPSVTA